MGFKIFLHSVKLVFDQLNGALRISGVLYLISLVLSVIGFIFFVPTMANQPPTFPWQSLLAAIAVAAIYLWIAVSWHRFVLLDELPNAPVPVFHGDRLLAYFGRGIQVGLIILVVGFIAGAVLTGLVFMSRGSPFISIPAMLALFVIMVLISYRLAPIFPSAAIGKSVGIGAAWASTSGASGTIIMLTIISVIASVIIDLPAQALQFLPGGIWLVFGWATITGWVKLMVGVSILTTLYGVYIEKRAIA